MIMFDLYNTPALPPAELDDMEAAHIIDTMADVVPVHVRAFPFDRDNVTVFWTTAPDGRVATVFEHTRYNAFNVPQTPAECVLTALRFRLEESAQSDDYDGYAVGE